MRKTIREHGSGTEGNGKKILMPQTLHLKKRLGASYFFAVLPIENLTNDTNLIKYTKLTIQTRSDPLSLIVSNWSRQ